MKLKKLEIRGFKSFADKTEILFDQGITGIVGPNGSGKSNIGDAVRWVLGEQSARVLRGARMEDVIFNGTAKRKAANYCEVSLLFDNEDGALKSNFSEVAVTRRVYRSGDSEYYLNQTACRLKDILELFRDTGIGREGYSLIGQGRIDEILSVKGEERRLIFEEAAGVMTYRVRKEEAERKLNRTTDNLSRVNDILDELGNRLEPLCRQAEVAKEYLETAERLKHLELNIFLIRHDKMKERIGALQQTVDTINDILQNHEALINETNEKRQELDEAIQLLEEELAAERAAYLSLNDEAHAAVSALEMSEQQATQTGEQNCALRNEIAEQQKHRGELESLFDKGESDTEKSREALKASQDECKKIQKKLEDAVADAEHKESELDEHKTAILAFVNHISEVKNVHARKQTMCIQMQERLSEMEAGMSRYEEEKLRLDENADHAKKVCLETEEELKKLREEAARLEGSYRLLSERTQQHSADIQKQNNLFQQNKSRLRLMEEMNREMEGYNGAVKRALKYAENDPAVYGVVARLIRVPKNLETAVDMVLGGALQNIVTRDEEAAKRMIDYLRVNRLGRATFLPMSSVRGNRLTLEEKKVLSMPGCMGIASELIDFDEKFRGIVENLLGRTVIARDLESGISIMRAGRHAFRLVTLEGDVMHSGGSMTGGTTQSKAVSLLSREREMNELKQRVAEQEDEIRKTTEELEKLILESESVKNLRDEAREAEHQQEIAVARDQERVFNAQAELSAHIQRMEQTKLACEQLRESITELTEDLRAAETETQNVTVDREAMDEKTVVLQQALRDARDKTDFLREEMQKAQLNYAELAHALDTLRRDRERRDEEIAGVVRRIAMLEEQLKEKELTLEQLTERIVSQKQREAKLSEAVQEKALYVEGLEARRRETVEQQRDCVEKSESAHKQYDEDSMRLHRTELALSRTDGELKALCDHIYNTYELTYSGAEAFRQTEGFMLSESEKESSALKGRIREMGPVNVGAIEEYADTKQRFDELTMQKNDLMNAQNDLQNLITRLLGQMEKQFVSEFDKLNDFFHETFERLFGGGQAELRLTDPADALNCGIEIIAQPPGKKLQLLSLLSGGERALTAIAILFAMLKLKPTPFCILDEIEAALDEANIGYFADYLSEYAHGTQFVVVTHRKGTMERCDSLFGVAMEEKGISKMVSVDLKDYE